MKILRLGIPGTLGLFAQILLAAPPPLFLLPADVFPKKYTIDLTIDPNLDTFDGWARIDVELRNAQTTIWLNAKDLTVQEATVRVGGKERGVRAEAAAGEFLGLRLEEPAGPGTALLSIHYRGRLNQKPVAGAYRVKFEGNWYVFTTFTPIDARRAFPCFDEPRFKTPWEMTLHVRREHDAFANSPAISEVDETGGMKAVHFAVTEPLPSEVVAFAVGPLETFEGGHVGMRSVPVRVITPKGHAAEAGYAARATAEVLPRLEAYTDSPYPYSKLDHLALPQIAFSAVENPGLITYRMDGLLIPSGKETPAKERMVRAIQAHELAHQWFGDLVTQAAWEDVWLSEGFATWLAQKVMDEEQPRARRHLSAVAARERIMAADAGAKTHPVRLAMHDREGMNGVYNPFAYQKGSAILLMLENWLGEERLRAALRAYLREHRFGTAATTDLAAALHAVSGWDVAPVMRAFLDQPGIPTVRAELNCEPGKTPHVVLEQAKAERWAIPVCWKAENTAGDCVVLDKPRLDFELHGNAACPAFLELNAGGNGYYRSEYTPEQASALAGHAAELSAAERLTLLYDLRAMEKAGRIEAGVMRALFRKLAADTEPEVARAAAEAVAGAP